MSKFCIKCARNKQDCCRSDYAKFTTLGDCKRISKFLELEIDEFIIYDELSDMDKKTDLFKLKNHGYYYDLSLKDGKILQLRKNNDGSCIFLNNDGACKIYDVRPLICMVYPFWYSEDNKIIIDQNGFTGCSIVEGSKVTNNFKSFKIKKPKDCEIKMIGETKVTLLNILSQLREEVKDYEHNLPVFLKENKLS